MARHFSRLLGLPGTGKSTWLAEHFATAAWIDLLHTRTLDDQFQRAIAMEPSAFPDRQASISEGSWLDRSRYRSHDRA